MEESRGLSKGGKCWFAIESKTFEISIEVVQGINFRLDCYTNKAGRFLLCSVRDVETKKFCLVFPEGKGLVGGWFLLAKKGPWSLHSPL